MSSQRFWSMPAASASLPVRTKSMSTLPASCWALSLPASSGAVARVKTNFETSSGCSLRNFSRAGWLTSRSPATSITLMTSGALGVAADDCAQPSAAKAITAAKPAVRQTKFRVSHPIVLSFVFVKNGSCRASAGRGARRPGELAGRWRIEEQLAVRMALQDRGRAEVRHRALDRRAYGLRLAGIGHRQDDERAAHDLLHGHGDCLARNVIQRREPALAELLPSASLVEFDALVTLRRGKVGRRIVEGEVAVLADAGEGHVDRVCCDQSVEALDLRIDVGGVAPDEVEGAQVGQVGDKPFLEIPAEARRMGLRHADIFVEVEGRHARPVDPWFGDQRGEELELAHAGGNDDVGVPPFLDGGADRLGAGRGRGRAERNLGWLQVYVDHGHPIVWFWRCGGTRSSGRLSPLMAS